MPSHYFKNKECFSAELKHAIALTKKCSSAELKHAIALTKGCSSAELKHAIALTKESCSAEPKQATTPTKECFLRTHLCETNRRYLKAPHFRAKMGDAPRGAMHQVALARERGEARRERRRARKQAQVLQVLRYSTTRDILLLGY